MQESSLGRVDASVLPRPSVPSSIIVSTKRNKSLELTVRSSLVHQYTHHLGHSRDIKTNGSMLAKPSVHPSNRWKHSSIMQEQHHDAPPTATHSTTP